LIKFKTVRYKNFLSTGNKVSEININDTRTTLMIGTNGAGKSTFLDAISFGLFGKPFRKVKLGQLVNSINQKNCMVELEFDVGGKEYLIKRGLKPAKFEIYVNGTMNDQMASARDSQDFLERYVLRMNERSFRQIVVLGSGSFIPFMRLGAGDRRSIIEELLDIQIFSVMNDLVKNRIGDNKDNLTDCEHQIELLEQAIRIQEEHLKSIQDNNEDAIREKKEELEQCEKQITDLNEEISGFREKIQDYNSKQTKYRKLTDFKSKITSKKAHICGQIKLVTENSECPECTQAITDEHQGKVTKKLGVKNDELDEAITDIDGQMLDVAQRINEIEDILTKISEKSNSISGIEEYSGRLKKRLAESLHPVESSSDDELSKRKNDLDDARNTKYDIQNKKHHLNTVQELLKDSGIKTVIIRNYLPLINQLINKYLSALNFYINFQLDEAFNETIKSRGRDAFQYGSFSEGEKLRIDLALLFTWREVAKLKSSVATNLLVLDEIFDSSLDSTGVEDFLGILNSLGDDTHAFVISHKGDQILDKFGRVITVEKEQNFSKIVTN
jgi:DNA repair exonuclease SbcCD ATPase subunit